jgi:hypothetical protein
MSSRACRENGTSTRLKRSRPRRPRTIDWESLGDYASEVGNASRNTTEPRAEDATPTIDLERVRSFRARRTHLDGRLPAGSLAHAARGGLQDSAPRDALLALHARVEDVTPHSWRDPSLTQVWFRWADYVVPREDADVFTLGSLPRNPAYSGAVIDLAERVVEVLGGEEKSPRDVAGAIGDIPNPLLIRAANVAGLFHIRWDARTVALLPSAPPRMDPEEARLELARRFLRWLGPAGPNGFARWAGVTRRDAEETWSALASDLITVAVEGRARSMLAADFASLMEAERVTGVRFLPQGDPYRARDRLVAQPEPTIDLPGVDRRLLNSLNAGRIMVDGKLVGSWGRRQHHLTIAPWGKLTSRLREEIAEEGSSLAGPIGKPMRLRWLG